MTLHLTAVEWERIAAAGSGVLFRPGIECDSGAHPMRCRCIPPDEFVEAAQPCEWCIGDGWLLGDPDHYERGTDAYLACDCNPSGDDPFDGKRRVAVVVPCGYCSLICERLHDNYEQAASEVGWATQEASRKPWSEVPESNRRTMMLAVSRTLHDCNDGLVTVSHVIVTWGPLAVVDWHSLQPWRPRVSVQGNGRVLLHRHVDEPTIDLGFPLPPDIDTQSLVGQYAIGVEVAS